LRQPKNQSAGSTDAIGKNRPNYLAPNTESNHCFAGIPEAKKKG